MITLSDNEGVVLLLLYTHTGTGAPLAAAISHWAQSMWRVAVILVMPMLM
jgi:hypothetical protein